MDVQETRGTRRHIDSCGRHLEAGFAECLNIYQTNQDGDREIGDHLGITAASRTHSTGYQQESNRIPVSRSIVSAQLFDCIQLTITRRHRAPKRAVIRKFPPCVPAALRLPNERTQA